MIGDALTLIDFLKKHWTEYSVKSALFRADGTRVDGDDFIVVDKIPVQDNDKIWFYKVREQPQYEFVYMPVIPSLHIDYGQIHGAQNPDAKVFRFVGNPLAKFTSGGEPNVIADFIVVGYKPKDLLAAKEEVNT